MKAKIKFFQRNTKGLMEYLRERDARKNIKVRQIVGADAQGARSYRNNK